MRRFRWPGLGNAALHSARMDEQARPESEHPSSPHARKSSTVLQFVYSRDSQLFTPPGSTAGCHSFGCALNAIPLPDLTKAGASTEPAAASPLPALTARPGRLSQSVPASQPNTPQHHKTSGSAGFERCGLSFSDPILATNRTQDCQNSAQALAFETIESSQ